MPPTHYTSSDGEMIASVGKQAIKRPNPVYLVESPEEFTVATNEGTLHGKPGDYLAYDPISTHVWPVSAAYVAMHYEFLEV